MRWSWNQKSAADYLTYAVAVGLILVLAGVLSLYDRPRDVVLHEVDTDATEKEGADGRDHQVPRED